MQEGIGHMGNQGNMEIVGEIYLVGLVTAQKESIWPIKSMLVPLRAIQCCLLYLAVFSIVLMK